MSNKMSVDRRALATRQRIAGALLRLGGMRGLAAVSVGRLAREAGISRSTFYAHFSGLDDFLARSFAEMLAALSLRSPDRSVLAVSEIIDHIASVGPVAQEIARSRHFPRMLLEGERALQRVCEARLSARHPAIAAADRQATATLLAAGFIALLRDWMDAPQGRSPAGVVQRFERMERLLVPA